MFFKSYVWDKLIEMMLATIGKDEPTTASNLNANSTTSIQINQSKDRSASLSVSDWTIDDVALWARRIEGLSKEVVFCLRSEEINGKVLLALSEVDIQDMRYRLNYHLSFGDLKRLWLSVRALQEQINRTKVPRTTRSHCTCFLNGNCPFVRSGSVDITANHPHHHLHHHRCGGKQTENTPAALVSPQQDVGMHEFIHSCDGSLWQNGERLCTLEECDCAAAMTRLMSIDEKADNIPTEFFKTFLSLVYSFLVTWLTSFVMVIVHERVPDMKRYPPLPDIFLDNVPYIPWAFHMCEITGTVLFVIWSCVCIFHKYRLVLLRRFFALAGTVFLLRCITMLITSLSVPGAHLQCDQSDYAVDDEDVTLSEALALRISRAYTIWSGLGMSIQGVRTCGDYMFSGHTVALTLLNFFITEYTPRNLYFLHTLAWLLNMFGIFFILAAHEHYSIDVFVAFYISSRLFLYYHTLANNQALKSRDSSRTRIWFPMFSYFESSVDGIVPNEFDSLSSLFDGLLRSFIDVKDASMTAARRLSNEQQNLALATKNLFLSKRRTHQNVSLSTSSHSTMTTISAECDGAGGGGVGAARYYSPISSQLFSETLSTDFKSDGDDDDGVENDND